MKAAARAHERFSRFLTEYLKEGVRPSCQAGCFQCCHGYVEASLGEAELALAAADADTRRRVYREGKRRAERLAREKEEEGMLELWFKSRLLCPFLKDGLCQVYEKRPLSCRGVLTDLSPRLCRPENDAWPPLDRRKYGPEHYLRRPKEESGKAFFRLLDEEARERGFTLAGDLAVLGYLLQHPPFQRALKKGPQAVRAYLARRRLLGGRFGLWLRLRSRR